MRTTTAGLVGMAFAAAVCLLPSPGTTDPPLALPPTLASYRTWSKLLTEPRPVPLELWRRCVPPSEADWSAARHTSGPHTQRYIMVYGTSTVAPAFSGRRPFAPGTVIAKEKLLDSRGGLAEGVAFMIKRPGPEFRDTDGWEFLYFPPAGDKQRTHEQCAACHRAAPKDYVFGDYPRDEG